MRSRLRRHLGFMLKPARARQMAPKMFKALAPGVESALVVGAPPDQEERVPVLPAEFSWRDYTILLLHIASEIEHSLMVQYLYAAWSLGGPQIPQRHREELRWMQNEVLAIAKEEMGHLITVQNVLRLLGAPLNLDREDYPWGSDFYPFPFSLEPMTLDVLARYVYAEAPEVWLESKEPADIKGGQQKKDARLDSFRRQVERLKILADVNDPLVKKRFEDGLGISWPLSRSCEWLALNPLTRGLLCPPYRRHE